MHGVAWMLQQEDQFCVEETIWKPEQLEQLLIRRVPLPDVFVFGCAQGHDGVEWTKLSHLPVPVVVISEEEERVEKWLHMFHGRAWALTVRSRASELFFALWTVSRGGCYISPSFTDQIQLPLRFLRRKQSLVSPPLTPMEKQVVMELVKDLTNQEIADQLGISRRTVDSHIASAIRKWGVNSRVGLAVRAVEEGWVPIEKTAEKDSLPTLTV